MFDINQKLPDMQKEENNRPNIEKENRSIERNYINDRIS
jgi:hypothetical protein